MPVRTDIAIPVASPAAVAACLQGIRKVWPGLRVEDALSGKKYLDDACIPFRWATSLIVYRDAGVEAMMDDDEEPPANTVVLLVRGADVTSVVADNPETDELRAILENVRQSLAEPLSA